jgi:hypothetical protein
MKLLWILSFLLIGLVNYAQHQELNEKSVLWKEKKKHHTHDSLTLFSAFHHGQFHGHFRSFSMFTDNQTGLSDYHAQAFGAGIKYESGSFYNFKFGISGFAVFNVASSNLANPDPSTNSSNRYEIGLFDIENPNNKSDIDRLEELYLKYSIGKTTITAGRQLINSTFVNLQDGRMRPTEIQGINAEIHDIKNIKIEAGIFNSISPRSTVRWFEIGESVGVYPAGVNEHGKPSGYADNIRSKFLTINCIEWKKQGNIRIKFLNQYVDRLFNTAFGEVEKTIKINEINSLALASMVIRQDATLSEDVYEEPERAYIQEKAESWVFGGRILFSQKNNQWSLNYTRITDHGRYNMPREWGRDPFYTFMSRERNEGLANVHAMVVKYQRKMVASRFKLQLIAGYFKLPEANDFVRNKYGVPSYYQVAADVRHEFEGALKGFDAQLLLIYKGAVGNTFDNMRFVINKVNVGLVNFVVNYHF